MISSLSESPITANKIFDWEEKLINNEMLVRDIIDLDTNIRSVNIFDVFEGGNLPQDKKSVAINVSIQADNKTLSDNDLNQISQKIIKEVENKTGGKIRS